jgi:hypothetical protein
MVEALKIKTTIRATPDPRRMSSLRRIRNKPDFYVP